eukprot:UN28247
MRIKMILMHCKKYAASISKQHALETALKVKNDEISRAKVEIEELKVKLASARDTISFETKKKVELEKQREERLQNLIEYQCGTIRNQLQSMAEQVGMDSGFGGVGGGSNGIGGAFGGKGAGSGGGRSGGAYSPPYMEGVKR